MQAVVRHPRARKAIAFVDCCGFSDYTSRHGDEAAVALHLRLRTLLDHEASEAGVEVVKWMGDGAMLAADDTLAVLTCLYQVMVRTREAGDLPLRAGVTVGTVTSIDGDYLGGAVNQAARLCAVADRWQVRTGADVEAVRFTLQPTPTPLRARRAA